MFGWIEGVDDGISVGLLDGQELGPDDGFVCGWMEGFDVGFSEGMLEGSVLGW